MNKTKIEWTDYTWNPVTGCKNNCFYCYGRKMNERFGKDYKPRFWWDRLDQPIKEKKPSKIFVCSIADLFGDWIPDDTINYVLDTVRKCPQHTFQFLTKNYKGYTSVRFPNNCWLGITVTSWKNKQRQGLLPPAIFGTNLRFASFEPLLGEINLDINYSFDWIIIGAMTGQKSQKYQPKESWIANILKQADFANIPIFMKNNLKKVWKGKLRQEFPNDQT